MAEKASYPQIPSTVWWGVRKLLQRSPNITINEKALGIEFNVQETAARQYLAELKRVGILNEDNKATEIANDWRHDDSYSNAVKLILSNVYPEGLVQIAPPGAADRQKVVSWFTREGLGVGTAANKAATYLMIGSAEPNDAPMRGSTSPQKNQVRDQKTTSKGSGSISPRASEQKSLERNNHLIRSEPIPLNINVQIHISADASNDQIEAIFAAMRRYLYEGSVS
jgi:hypothetical protein